MATNRRYKTRRRAGGPMARGNWQDWGVKHGGAAGDEHGTWSPVAGTFAPPFPFQGGQEEAEDYWAEFGAEIIEEMEAAGEGEPWALAAMGDPR